MVKLFADFKIDRKHLFHAGKTGFSVCLILFGLMLLTGIIDKTDDLKSYFNFW
jgi:hypothetical protein